MPDDIKSVLCYNRGCGQTYDPSGNTPESCRHHPGYPVFHDAYKGWSCCNKKCTDFTEFLNIKGCTVSFHSNVKPPEPEKPKKEVPDVGVIEYRPPIPPAAERPPFDSPMVLLRSEVTASLKAELAKLASSDSCTNYVENNPTDIPIGTTCKNNSCKTVYEGVESSQSKCTHHPGCPVFHEGLKFWTCCNKRTTDFNAFLDQIGCNIGQHLWFKKKSDGEAKCRLDWHQTGSDVYVTIFSKTCDPSGSSVHLSPVRLKMSLYFPVQSASFNKDIHLQRLVDVKKSSVTYFNSKVEIKLAKHELGSWSKLELPGEKSVTPIQADSISKEHTTAELSQQVESVDLSCI